MTHTHSHTRGAGEREQDTTASPRMKRIRLASSFLRRPFDAKLAEANLKSFNAPKYNPQFRDHSPPSLHG